MKIAYINNHPVPSEEAPGVHIMKMCRALSNNGHDVHLIGPHITRDVDVYEYYNVDHTFKIHFIWKPRLKFFGHLLNIILSLAKAKKLKPDIIYTRNDLTAYMATSLGFTTVYECHNPVVFSGMGKIREFFFRKVLDKKKLLLLVVISDSTKRYVIEKYRFVPDDILLARDSADPIDENISPLKFENDKDIQVGYIGSLYRGRGKGIIKYLAENCDFAHFHVVGGTPENIKIWKDDIRVNNISFHGFVPQKKVARYMISMDILLAPYQSDVRTAGGKHNAAMWMSPLKIFEYMSSGKPIIASDLPAIREILVNEEDALLCGPDDHSSWRESIVRLRDDNRLRKELGNNARNKFLRSHTWDKRTKDIIRNIEKRLGR